jgi:hypothetical protein
MKQLMARAACVILCVQLTAPQPLQAGGLHAWATERMMLNHIPGPVVIGDKRLMYSTIAISGTICFLAFLRMYGKNSRNGFLMESDLQAAKELIAAGNVEAAKAVFDRAPWSEFVTVTVKKGTL